MTASLSCPRRWGDYLLVSPLGLGGMGVVYLAVTGAAERERLCVVKMLQADAPFDPDRLRRFHREAEIVRKLSHGAIAQTLAIDEVDGTLSIVQEHIHGRNLSQVVSSARSVAPGRIPTVLGVHIVREVARALAHAHLAGIVHRDVAPQNVMVAFSGEVKLIDFGVARLADSSEGSVALTRPGELFGRMVYTAPEVLEGGRADRRADVYSAGVLLWELLTGHLPLFGDDESRRTAPPPSSLQPDVPPELDAAVLKALAQNPSDRFESAEDLQRALGPCVPGAFVGEPELRAFIGHCYDVEAERQHVNQQVAEARRVVTEDGPSESAGPEQAPGRRQRGRSASRVVAALCLGATAVGAAAFLARAPSNPAPRADVRLAVAEPSAPREAASPARVVQVDAFDQTPTSGPPANRPQRPLARAAVSARRAPKPGSAGPSPGVLLDQALDSLQAGDVDLAMKDARGVLEARATPLEKAGAHVILGKSFVLRGDRSRAEAEFSAAIELDPNNEAATAALARLRGRRGQ